MKVFISWSGESSKVVAVVLHDWLKLIFPELDFWVSSRDIRAGERWGTKLDEELESTSFGVLCLDPTNLLSPWLVFEAGSLAREVASSRVVPYCFGLAPEEVQGPLSRFQGVSGDRNGTWRLVESINSVLDTKRTEDVLRKTFDKWWSDLENEFKKVPTTQRTGPSLVEVRGVLCAATAAFQKLGASEDMEVLEASYPGSVTRIEDANLARLRDTLALGRFEIVHLLGFVDPKSGDFFFDDNERLAAEGLLKLLQRAGTELLFLATCDSLTLGAKMSRSISVIAASENVEAAKMVKWERCFYGLLKEGMSLAVAYDLAQATEGLPMQLLIRNDRIFLPSTRAAKPG